MLTFDLTMQSCKIGCFLWTSRLSASPAAVRNYGTRRESKPWKQRPNRKAKLALILREDVPKLGRSGHVVRVEHGHGRNWLLPQGKAVYATPDNMKLHNAVEQEQGGDSDVDIAAFVRSVFAKHEIIIPAPETVSEDEEWGVYEHHIAKALRRFRLHVPLDCIHLPSPLTSYGAHSVSLTLDNKTDVPFTVSVVERSQTQSSNDAVDTSSTL